MSDYPFGRTRCRYCGAPLLLTERCPYCDERLELLGEFADWIEEEGADR